MKKLISCFVVAVIIATLLIVPGNAFAVDSYSLNDYTYCGEIAEGENTVKLPQGSKSLYAKFVPKKTGCYLFYNYGAALMFAEDVDAQGNFTEFCSDYSAHGLEVNGYEYAGILLNFEAGQEEYLTISEFGDDTSVNIDVEYIGNVTDIGINGGNNCNFLEYNDDLQNLVLGYDIMSAATKENPHKLRLGLGFNAVAEFSNGKAYMVETEDVTGVKALVQGKNTVRIYMFDYYKDLNAAVMQMSDLIESIDWPKGLENYTATEYYNGSNDLMDSSVDEITVNFTDGTSKKVVILKQEQCGYINAPNGRTYIISLTFTDDCKISADIDDVYTATVSYKTEEASFVENLKYLNNGVKNKTEDHVEYMKALADYVFESGGLNGKEMETTATYAVCDAVETYEYVLGNFMMFIKFYIKSATGILGLV